MLPTSKEYLFDKNLRGLYYATKLNVAVVYSVFADIDTEEKSLMIVMTIGYVVEVQNGDETRQVGPRWLVY